VLVKTLVKHEKKLKFSNRLLQHDHSSIIISQIATKTVTSPPTKLDIVEEDVNDLCDEKVTAKDTCATAPSSADKVKKKQRGFFAFRRREFIMRILDFNFFLLF